MTRMTLLFLDVTEFMIEWTQNNLARTYGPPNKACLLQLRAILKLQKKVTSQKNLTSNNSINAVGQVSTLSWSKQWNCNHLTTSVSSWLALKVFTRPWKRRSSSKMVLRAFHKLLSNRGKRGNRETHQMSNPEVAFNSKIIYVRAFYRWTLKSQKDKMPYPVFIKTES